MRPLHARTHPSLSESDCFACRISTINLAAAATPFRREQTVTRDTAWAKQMRDDVAYKELYRNGLNPRGTANCHELAQTDDRNLIEGNPSYWDKRHEYLESNDELPQVKVES